MAFPSPRPALLVERADMEGDTVLRLTGDLDFETAGQVPGALPAPTEVRRLVVDISRLDFVDSVGIAVFIKLHREFGSQLGLVPDLHQLHRLLEITGLGDLFASFDSVAAARAG